MFGARVSLLRAVYRAVFAKFGNTYALRPELELVPKQIARNKTLVIPYFSASGSASAGPRPELAVAALNDGPNAVVGVFAHQLVFLPWQGSAAVPLIASNVAADGRWRLVAVDRPRVRPESVLLEVTLQTLR